MTENKLADLSMDFAVNILKTTDGIKGHPLQINLSAVQHQLVQTYARQNMLIAKQTLYLNFKLH